MCGGVGDEQGVVSVIEPPPADSPMLLPSTASVDQIRARLKELGAAIYGTKAQLHIRIVQAESKRAVNEREQAEIAACHQQLAEGSGPRVAEVSTSSSDAKC